MKKEKDLSRKEINAHEKFKLEILPNVSAEMLNELEMLSSFFDDLIYARENEHADEFQLQLDNEAQLIQKIAEGSFPESAFQQLVRLTIDQCTLRDYLVRFFVARGATSDVVDDYVVDALLLVYEGLKKRRFKRDEWPAFRQWVCMLCEELLVPEDFDLEKPLENHTAVDHDDDYASSILPTWNDEMTLEDIKASVSDIPGQSLERMMETYAKSLQATFGAESCGIFLVPEDSPAEFVLQKNFSDQQGAYTSPIRLSIPSLFGAPDNRKNTHSAKIVRLQGDALRNHTFLWHNNDLQSAYLNGGYCHSLLAVALLDNHNKTIGLLLLINKKDKNGEANDDIGFDELDEAIGRTFAQVLIRSIENIKRFHILQTFYARIRNTNDRNQILRYFFQTALRISRADGGILTIADDLFPHVSILISTFEHQKSTFDVAKEDNLISQAWHSRKGVRSHVRTVVEGATLSGCTLAIPLATRSETRGVLLLNSADPGGFKPEDLSFFRQFAHNVETYIQFVENESKIALWPYRKPPEKVLSTILEGVKSLKGLDSGIIYIADYVERKLINSAFISGKILDIKRTEKFSYHFDTPALATRVFHQREAIFVDDPTDTTQVNLLGIQAFDIQSPIIGLPLIAENNVVGVLVVWSSSAPYPTPGRIQELEAFADLAAAHVSLYSSGWHQSQALHYLDRTIRSLQFGANTTDLWSQIMQGVLYSGFNRVRVYKFLTEEQAFKCIDSLDESGDASRGLLKGMSVHLSDSWFSRDIYQLALKDSKAHVYDPLALRKIDPYARKINKPDHSPWAVVPLVFSGKVLGQIATDNVFNGQAISNSSLKYLTYFGALGSQLMAKNLIEESMHETQKYLYELTEGFEAKNLDSDTASALVEEVQDCLEEMKSIAFGHINS